MLSFIKRHLFYFTYFPGVLLIWASLVYFNQEYLIPQHEPHKYYTLTSLNVATGCLALLSYIQIIRISNNVPNNLPFPRVKTQLRNNHPYYIYHNKCENEGDKFKPLRASHSSKLGCIVRFNNYCAWANNCIGYCNHKAYILFTFYGGVGCLSFFVNSILKYIDVVDSGTNPMTQNETSLWMLLTIGAFILFLILLGLTVSSLQLLWKNITYIQMLKGLFSFIDKDGSKPNPFDLGFTTNYATFFEGHSWLFWFPSAHVPRFDGTKFPMVPPITDKEKKSIFHQIQQYLKDPIEKTITQSFEQFYAQQSPQYKNAIIHYMGEQYTLEGCIQKKEEEVQEVSAASAPGTQEDKDILAGVYDESE